MSLGSFETIEQNKAEEKGQRERQNGDQSAESGETPRRYSWPMLYRELMSLRCTALSARRTYLFVSIYQRSSPNSSMFSKTILIFTLNIYLLYSF